MYTYSDNNNNNNNNNNNKYELNECHVHHMTFVIGEMEKIQIDFNCLFLSK